MKKNRRFRKKVSSNFEIESLLPKNELYELKYTSKCWKLNKKADASIEIKIEILL